MTIALFILGFIYLIQICWNFNELYDMPMEKKEFLMNMLHIMAL
jgi:hypothetical protein